MRYKAERRVFAFYLLLILPIIIIPEVVTPWLTEVLEFRSEIRSGALPLLTPPLAFLIFKLTTYCAYVMFSNH